MGFHQGPRAIAEEFLVRGKERDLEEEETDRYEPFKCKILAVEDYPQKQKDDLKDEREGYKRHFPKKPPLSVERARHGYRWERTFPRPVASSRASSPGTNTGRR